MRATVRPAGPKLVSHINDDGDLLQAWLDHYLRMGVGSFHLIVHGPRSENTRLFELHDAYPIVVEDTYEGEFDTNEKLARLSAVLKRNRGQWIMLVDSDEFVELPYRSLYRTISMLEILGANVLSAPMLQRLRADGSLETATPIADPFREFPLCSLDLYRQMGVNADTDKYPLFWCGESTAPTSGGNHGYPNGRATVLSPLQAVTHHFKWRTAVRTRLARRIDSSHPWRHESRGYQAFLEANDFRLPTAGAFTYSGRELFQRGLLRRLTARSLAGYVLRRIATRLAKTKREALGETGAAAADSGSEATKR